MSGTTPFDTKALRAYVQILPGWGALAAQVLTYIPGIVELLYPAKAYLKLNDFDRALMVQALTERSIDVVKHRFKDAGEAQAVIVGLTKGYPAHRRTLEQRRYKAAKLFGVEPRTFRDEGYERDFLFQLAVEMYRLHMVGEPGQP